MDGLGAGKLLVEEFINITKVPEEDVQPSHVLVIQFILVLHFSFGHSFLGVNGNYLELIFCYLLILERI